MNVCVLFGSASRTGYTYELVKKVFGDYKHNFIKLSEKNIQYFDHQNKFNEKDEFLSCIYKMLTHDLICIASPVYWYCVSAQTKVFLDRLTDLLYFHRDLLQELRKKPFVFLSTYGNEPGFALEIVQKTLTYLECKLYGHMMVNQSDLIDLNVDDFQEECLDAVHESTANTIKLHTNSV